MSARLNLPPASGRIASAINRAQLALIPWASSAARKAEHAHRANTLLDEATRELLRSGLTSVADQDPGGFAERLQALQDEITSEADGLLAIGDLDD